MQQTQAHHHVKPAFAIAILMYAVFLLFLSPRFLLAGDYWGLVPVGCAVVALVCMMRVVVWGSVLSRIIAILLGTPPLLFLISSFLDLFSVL